MPERIGNKPSSAPSVPVRQWGLTPSSCSDCLGANAAVDNDNFVAGEDLAYFVVNGVTVLSGVNLTSFEMAGNGNSQGIDDVSGRIRARAADAPIEVSAATGSLRLRTNRGDVRVSEVEGDVDVRASAGSLEISWITGDVAARTGRGEIAADHVSGSLSLASGRGGIEIRDVEGPAMAKTELGGILASFVGAPEGELETSRGSVRVMVSDETGADLEAISRRGSVELAPGLPLEGARNEAHVVGKLGPGGAPLRLYTARGSVYLSRR